MNIFKINLKAFVYLMLTFIAMTVIGTVSHELGHYSAAKLLGYDASINYRSASYWDDDLSEYFNDIFHKYSFEIKNKLPFAEKEEYYALIEKHHKNAFYITLGGPLQTMLTGTLGVLLLLINRKKYIKVNSVSVSGWMLIFMSLFWLRQTANLCMSVFSYLLKGRISFKSDETKLALYLNLNIWTIKMITGFLGIIVLLIILKLIPKRLLITFILAGCVGGVLGFYLWLVKFGQYIMP